MCQNKEKVDEIFVKVGHPDRNKLSEIESHLNAAQLELIELESARKKHLVGEPKRISKEVAEMDTCELLQHGSEVDQVFMAQHNSWRTVEMELRRRIMAKSNEVKLLKDEVAACKYIPIKHHGDELANLVADAFRNIEGTLEELLQIEKLEFELVGLNAQPRFNTRTAPIVREIIAKWGTN